MISWFFTGAGKGYHVENDSKLPSLINITNESGELMLSFYEYEAEGIAHAVQNEACGVTEPVSEKLGITPADDRTRELTERMQRAEDHAAGLHKRLDVLENRLDHVSHNVIGEIINALVNR